MIMGDPRPRRVWFNDRDPAIIVRSGRACSVARRSWRCALGRYTPEVASYKEFDEELSPARLCRGHRGSHRGRVP